MIEPYYDDGAVTLYLGDAREVLPVLDDAIRGGVLVTDPPYGAAIRPDNATRGRSQAAAASDFPPIRGDDRPFDPGPLLDLGLPSVIFGANYFSDRLPPSTSWLVWDKRDGLTSKREVGFNDSADVELAWSNLGGPARLYSQRWLGMIRRGEDAQTKRRHPTEKPVELMRWVLAQVPDGVVVDPFAGSGSTLRAAKDLGRRAIGIEIEERYCAVAVKRLAQGVLAL